MELYFGPAGIPLSCKGRTFLDGIEDINMLGLNAMEIQLVRNIGSDIHGLDDVREFAKKLNVRLSVHAPYYIDLIGNKESVARSIEKITWCGDIADQIGAKTVVTGIGPYWQFTPKTALERAVENIRWIRDRFEKEGFKTKLGLEPSGRRDLFGCVDELLSTIKRVSNTIPVLSFHHIHAREDGFLRKKEDFQVIFDKVRAVTKSKNFYITFSGVEYKNGSELRTTPIKKGDLKFETLVECILDNNYNMTIISTSPLLEHDAMYMKVILERVKMKREIKELRKETGKKGGK
jgi:deoxyribonuclease-4